MNQLLDSINNHLLIFQNESLFTSKRKVFSNSFLNYNFLKCTLLLYISRFNTFPSNLCPKPFNNEYPRKKKILHISSELSQLAIRYNWRYLRSKSAIVYDGGKAKCGRGLVHRWLNENCSGQQVQLIPTIGSKFLSPRKCRMFFPLDLHNFHLLSFSTANSWSNISK